MMGGGLAPATITNHCPIWRFDQQEAKQVSQCPVLGNKSIFFVTEEAKNFGLVASLDKQVLVLSHGRRFVRLRPYSDLWNISGNVSKQEGCSPVFHQDKIVLSLDCGQKLFGALLGAPIQTPLAPAGKPVVVIDPGHGGHDTGAFHNKIAEKDVVLDLAKMLEREMKKQGKVQPVLTRNNDQFMSLETRSLIANKINAAAFVSLHCNSNPDSKLTGAETYILSSNRVDAPSRMLATKENSLSYMPALKAEGASIRDIIKSLEQEKFLRDSHQLALGIQDSFVSNRISKHRGIFEAPFAVLQRAAMPAVLVEVGYLTNRQDAYKLTNPVFLLNVAQALNQAITNFLVPAEANVVKVQ